MKAVMSRYKPSYVTALVYMLQSCEYHPAAYIRWYAKTSDFSDIMYRRQLDPTKPARMLLLGLKAGIGTQLIIAGLFVAYGWSAQSAPSFLLGLIIAASYPFIWPYIIILPLVLGRLFIIGPAQRRQIVASESLFAKTRATKIAIAGSYGKTSMKELLLTVLSEGKKVAATPANKNVAISHAQFVRNLNGGEEVLVIEYGEGKPGDVAQFAKTTKPDIGIITGLAPAHLDMYKTLQAAGEDIMSLASYLKDKDVYITGESEALKPFIKEKHHVYSQQKVLDWKISNIKVDLKGVTFTMKRKSQVMNLASGLLGRHQVAPLALAAALARELGMDKAETERGIAKTRPFEHRMQPRDIGGATIIDDTYNGNIEGVRAGLKLLQELPGKRKLYVTPGLVDQGDETQVVHNQLGRMIAEANPDVVVLMQNSVTAHIQIGLQEGGYKGQVLVETDPLAFYTDLTSMTAKGDIVLMQNDWTDNYK